MREMERKYKTGQVCALTNACQRLNLIRDWTAEKINLSDYDNSKPGAPKNRNGHDGEEVADLVVYTLHSPFCCTIGPRDWFINRSIVGTDTKAEARFPLAFKHLVCHRRHPNDGVDAATSR